MAKQTRAKQSQAKPKNKSQGKSKNKPQAKVRGTWLTVALVIIVLHGLLAAIFYATVRVQEADVARPMVLTLTSIHFLANVVAAVGIWYWKKWALYVYAMSAVLALVLGLVTVGAWSVFYMVLPVAILGWLLRTKWDYFS